MPRKRRRKRKTRDNRIIIDWYTDEEGRKRPITAPKTISKAKLKKLHESRKKLAKAIDESIKAKRIPAKAETWMRHPNRYDMPGIDLGKVKRKQFRWMTSDGRVIVGFYTDDQGRRHPITLPKSLLKPRVSPSSYGLKKLRKLKISRLKVMNVVLRFLSSRETEKHLPNWADAFLVEVSRSTIHVVPLKRSKFGEGFYYSRQWRQLHFEFDAKEKRVMKDYSDFGVPWLRVKYPSNSKISVILKKTFEKQIDAWIKAYKKTPYALNWIHRSRFSFILVKHKGKGLRLYTKNLDAVLESPHSEIETNPGVKYVKVNM